MWIIRLFVFLVFAAMMLVAWSLLGVDIGPHFLAFAVGLLLLYLVGNVVGAEFRRPLPDRLDEGSFKNYRDGRDDAA